MSMTENILLSLPLRKLGESYDNTFTIRDIRLIHDNPYTVIDLWHTKCTKCPAALEKLNDLAGSTEKTDSLYISIALSLGDGNFEVASDVTEGLWENLTNLFLDESDKDQVKSFLGYQAVPYYIVLDKDGSILQHGDPKLVDYVKVIESAKSKSSSNTISANGLELDEDF